MPFDLQIQESLAPKSADPTGYWKYCKKNYTTCDAKQIQFLQGTMFLSY